MKPRRVFAASVVAISVASAQAPSPERHWKITGAKKSCVATEVCAKGKPCDKPAAYACPEDVDLPFKVVKHEASTECFYESSHACGHCNPPPPMKLPCPGD